MSGHMFVTVEDRETGKTIIDQVPCVLVNTRVKKGTHRLFIAYDSISVQEFDVSKVFHAVSRRAEYTFTDTAHRDAWLETQFPTMRPTEAGHWEWHAGGDCFIITINELHVAVT
jgi:hypothetical protein